MPAQSQQQQKLFGLALSVKRGETPRSEASADVLGIVDSMTEKEIEDFASTSHKGLPKKVEQQIREMVREIMRERAISEMESVNEAKIYKVIFAGIQAKNAKDFFTMIDRSPKIKAMTKDSGVFKVGNEVTIRFGVGSKQELELIKKVAKLEGLKIVKIDESVNEGKKRFRQQDGIGKAKYTISYHDGKQKHKDGSDFFGIQIFKNKKDLETFRNALLKKGYIEESIEEGIISEVERGDMGYVEKHKSIATVYDVMGKKLKVKLGKTGKVVTIDSKDIQILPESVNERLTNSDIKRMEGLHSYKKMDEALKSLVFIGKELYEEGFEKPEITEFILKKVQRRLFLQLKESTNEGIEPQIKKIAYFTGTRPEAVEDFVSKHALNITKLLKYVEKGGLPQRMELVSAIAGRPNNPKQKKIIKMFNESVNEGYSTEEKRIVMMAVRKLAKYRNVPINQSINDLLGAGQELERDIKKGKITK
jgi:hypothetical protein